MRDRTIATIFVIVGAVSVPFDRNPSQFKGAYRLTRGLHRLDHH